MSSLFKTIQLYFTQSVSAQIVYRWWIVQFLLGESIHTAGLTYYWTRAGSTAAPNSLYGNASAIVTYFILVTFHVLIEEIKLDRELSMAIRSGRLSCSMIRPVHPLLGYVVNALGSFAVRFIMLLPIFAIVFLVFDSLREVVFANFSQNVFPYLCSLVLLVLMSLTLRLVLGLLAFRMTQTWGPELIFLSVFAISSGSLYPLDLLPKWAFEAASWTPCFYLAGFPALILNGHISGDLMLNLLGRGCFVLVICILLVVASWKQGLRQYEAVGI